MYRIEISDNHHSNGDYHVFRIDFIDRNRRVSKVNLQLSESVYTAWTGSWMNKKFFLKLLIENSIKEGKINSEMIQSGEIKL